MTTVENQKVITTNATVHDIKHIYAKVSIEAAEEAMDLLKPNTFKVWFYMAKNQDNYTFALSRVDVCKKCKMTKPTYLACIQELIDVGYLVNTSGNHYNFFEKLPPQNDTIEITVNK